MNQYGSLQAGQYFYFRDLIFVKTFKLINPNPTFPDKSA
jgi:hypothetical protein